MAPDENQPAQPEVPALSDREFERRLTTLYPRLKKQAVYYVGGQEAEDLVQEVCTTLWANRHRYTRETSETSFDGWAFICLRHKFLNLKMRPSFTDKNVVFTGTLYGEEEESVWAYHFLNAKADAQPDSELGMRHIQDVMDLYLPPHLSLILKLKVIGYTYEEIMDLLKISYSAARGRCHEARNKLRKHLSALGQERVKKPE